MHVAVNASIVDARPTGLGIYTTSVVRELAGMLEDGDRLTVLTGYPEAFAGSGADVVALSRFVQPRYGKPGGMFRLAWTQTALPALLRRGGYDLFYSTTHHGLPYRLPGVPQVLTIQNDVEVSFRFPAQHRLQYRYFRHVVPRLMRASARVVTTSRYALEVLRRIYGLPEERLAFAYNGYDAGTFRPEPGPEEAAVRARYGAAGDYLFTVGAFYPHKNVETLLAALPEVRRRHPALRLVIAGYAEAYLGPLLAGLDAETRGAVVAHPYVAQRDLAALYRGAAAFVFPSLHESFGIPLVEAMAAGCPVIASRASALPEIGGDAVLFVEAGSAPALAGAIDRVLAEPALRGALVERGLARATAFGWRATARTIYDILRGAAAPRPLPAAPAGRAAALTS
ncbi:MAG TPA: glycosyltransferase family 1 protein [Gemmatimonadales bacterium]|nr:glycosyltransferase family 1 protein [Gemmatimonadales bacterium]